MLPVGGSGSRRRRPEGGRRRRAAAVGARNRRRGCSGGDWARRRGLRAARGHGGADSGVCVGGGVVEERGDGELELAGVRADGGGVLGVRGGERANE